jgi:uncharacterized protein YPO0396
VTQSGKDIEQEIAELSKRRDELRGRLVSIEKDYRAGLSADSDEQAIQLENADVLAGIAKATADELARIEARLEELG